MRFSSLPSNEVVHPILSFLSPPFTCGERRGMLSSSHWPSCGLRVEEGREGIPGTEGLQISRFCRPLSKEVKVEEWVDRYMQPGRITFSRMFKVWAERRCVLLCHGLLLPWESKEVDGFLGESATMSTGLTELEEASLHVSHHCSSSINREMNILVYCEHLML